MLDGCKEFLELLNFEYIENDMTCDELDPTERIERYYELVNDKGTIVYLCHQDTVYIHSGLGLGFYSAYKEVDEDNQCYGYEVKIRDSYHLQCLLAGLMFKPPVDGLEHTQQDYIFTTKENN